MATYNYSPHQHIKIWLSNTPHRFMNLENQVRLIKMREQNPDDIIHLVYDSTLLTPVAQNDLTVFCKENNIIPVDADKLPTRLISKNERILFKFYKDEICHLSEGGNLAVASDILRWISPIYQLGSYSDFDYPVDTSILPKFIKVQSPLLLNIGTLKIGQKEFILANNDYIAVVDATAAKADIERVQQGIISRLTQYSTDFIEKTEQELQQGSLLNNYLIKLMKNRAEVFYISHSNTLGAQPNSSRNIRKYVHETMSDKNTFLNFNRQSPEENDASVIHRLRAKLQKELNLIKYLFFSKEYAEMKSILQQNDDAFIVYLMKTELELYLKSIVVCTTGPLEISRALFNGYVLDTKKIVDIVHPLSFNYYNLQKAFQSPNSIPLHENILGMLRFMGVDKGVVDDSSWLESGRVLQEGRAHKLEEQQQELASNLASSLLEIKEHMFIQLQRVSQKSNKIFFKRRQETYKAALQEILSCFHHEKNEFDVAQFKSILVASPMQHADAFSSLFFKDIQEQIKHLEKISYNAVVFRLTENKKIKLNYH